MVLFDDKMAFDEEGIVFYPNGDINRRELEKILHEAHIKKYSDSRSVECYERVRLSDPEAEFPAYGRKSVKMTIGALKKIYGCPYDPIKNKLNNVINDAIPVIINGEVYDMGS